MSGTGMAILLICAGGLLIWRGFQIEDPTGTGIGPSIFAATGVWMVLCGLLLATILFCSVVGHA